MKANGLAYCTLSLFLACGCQEATRTTSQSTTTQATKPAETAPQNNWQVDRDVSPVTGIVTTTASLKYQGNQNIVVRQIGKKLECFIETDEFLETVDNMESRISTVQYRFDGGKVIRQGWVISDNNEGLFYPGSCTPFLAQLRGAKILDFEYRPAEKIPATITFDVTGFPDEFKVDPLRPSSKRPPSTKAGTQLR